MRRTTLVVALLLAVACMREKPDVSQDSPSQSSEATPVNPQAGTGQNTALNPTVPINTDSPTTRVPAAANPSEGGVQLLEYQIRMPDTIRSGVTLQALNTGKEKHAFAVEGTNLKTADLNPTDSAPVLLNLAPGTYTVYCPIEGHREKGMSKTVTVVK